MQRIKILNSRDKIYDFYPLTVSSYIRFLNFTKLIIAIIPSSKGCFSLNNHNKSSSIHRNKLSCPVAPYEIVVPVFHPFRHEARVNSAPTLRHETVNAPLGPGIPFPYSTIAIQGHAECPERLRASFHPATSSLHREKPVSRAIMRLELEIPATIGRSFDELRIRRATRTQSFNLSKSRATSSAVKTKIKTIEKIEES